MAAELSWDDVPLDALDVTNERGVVGEEILRTFVPKVCLDCDHFDGGDCGDYGTVYSYPGCSLGLILPTRKGTCKRFAECLR